MDMPNVAVLAALEASEAVLEPVVEDVPVAVVDDDLEVEDGE